MIRQIVAKESFASARGSLGVLCGLCMMNMRDKKARQINAGLVVKEYLTTLI